MNNQEILKKIKMLEKVFKVEPEEPDWMQRSREIQALLKEYEQLTRGMSEEDLYREEKEAAREIMKKYAATGFKKDQIS